LNAVVRLSNVSKKYNLGVTRRSVIESLTKGARRILSSEPQAPSESQVLWAVRDVSFELAPGESLGLIGRNGAGKSTMLKLLAKITRPTSGEIKINGRLSALIELGSGFHHDLTGRENIFLNGTILGLTRQEIKRRFDEIVAFSEIEQFIDTPVKRYSSGMLVRLGFSVASCIEPDILLVDEVLAVGDASFRQKCLQRIRSLIRNGTTIIFVSHNLYMVQAVCPMSLYVVKGQIRVQGTTTDVIDTYERDLHEERARSFKSGEMERENIVGSLQLVGIEVLDASGSRPEEFLGSQSVEIRVHYRSDGYSGPGNAVVRLVRTDGLTCCEMRTSIDGFGVNYLDGDGVLSVLVEPLQLTGGTYIIDVELLNEDDSVVLSRGWSKAFYVSGRALSHEEHSGVFEPKRRWKQ
jgi:lipopolysaccharide transport system ATP-binding protein